MKADQTTHDAEEPEYVDEVFEDPDSSEDDPWGASETRSAKGSTGSSQSTDENALPSLNRRPGPDSSRARPPIKPAASSPRPEGPQANARAKRPRPVGSQDETAPTGREVKPGAPLAPQAPRPRPSPGRHLQRPFPHGESADRARKASRSARVSEAAPATSPTRQVNAPEIARPGRQAEIASSEAAPDKSPGQLPADAVSTAIPEWVMLEKLLAEHRDLPQGSLVIGVDEAGKPLVLALDDPSNGPLLVLGEDPSANRKHLRAILASAEQINPPDLLQIDIITPVKSGFDSDRSNLRTVCEPGEPGLYERLAVYLETIEDRIRTRRSLPFQILVLDEVDQLLERLSEDSLRFLRWMMRRGPAVGVQLIASIDTARLETFDLKTFRAFDLKLCGKITAEETARTYTGISPDILKRLVRGAEGCFKLDDRLIRYSIPEFAGG